ncbi:MAG: cyclomaltodextrinase N-terminal domain-containing protein, partial [Gammaproteobacteria bacterium]
MKKMLSISLHIAAACSVALAPSAVRAQQSAAPGIDRVEPPFWWVAMHNPKLQLMIHGTAIADAEPSLQYPGVHLDSVVRVPNRNYVILNLSLDEHTRPGSFDIVFVKAEGSLRYRYQLHARAAGSAERRGFGSADAIYQIMPDRFANGDSSNDRVTGMADQ